MYSNIFRSFYPFISLLMCNDDPQVQLWAVWAIHHVCTKNREWNFNNLLVIFIHIYCYIQEDNGVMDKTMGEVYCFLKTEHSDACSLAGASSLSRSLENAPNFLLIMKCRFGVCFSVLILRIRKFLIRLTIVFMITLCFKELIASLNTSEA